jgi:hypothetical protein
MMRMSAIDAEEPRKEIGSRYSLATIMSIPPVEGWKIGPIHGLLYRHSTVLCEISVTAGEPAANPRTEEQI